MDQELNQIENAIIAEFRSLSDVEEWQNKLERRYKAGAISDSDNKLANAWLSQIENNINKSIRNNLDEQ